MPSMYTAGRWFHSPPGALTSDPILYRDHSSSDNISTILNVYTMCLHRIQFQTVMRLATSLFDHG